jgi:hypothetical protein
VRDAIRRARGKQEQTRATEERAFDDAELAPVVALFGAEQIDPPTAGIVEVVGSIRRSAPELAGDLRDAIGVWLQLDELRTPGSALDSRRERLSILGIALRPFTVDLDPRD